MINDYEHQGTAPALRRLHAPRMQVSIWIAMSPLMFALAAHSQAAEVWVIADHAHPVISPAGIRHIELDAADRILAKLNADLPADPKQAAEAATRRVQSSSALYQQLRIAYQGVVDAWSLGVTTIPAVVLDRRYVVYGESNVEHALRLIQAFKESHQ